MVRYVFYTIGDLTYQSPLVDLCLGYPWKSYLKMEYPNLSLSNFKKLGKNILY